MSRGYLERLPTLEFPEFQAAIASSKTALASLGVTVK
jgi:hypothetical protein